MTVFNPEKAASDTWHALLDAGCFVEGSHKFASGIESTLKVDAEELYKHPRQLEIVIGHFALHPAVQDADVLLYVPDGMSRFITTLGERLNKPVVNTIRRPEATTKYSFMFASSADLELAQSAKKPFIGEDVVTTLGSVAALRRLLRPDQNVSSLSILLRGTVDEQYRTGLTDHYLLTREIPTDATEFRRLLANPPDSWNI